MVLEADFLKLSCVVASMAIKDNGPPFATEMLAIFNGNDVSVESNHIFSPALVTNSNLPVCLKASMVLQVYSSRNGRT